MLGELEYWIQIKEQFMKHFQKDEYKRLKELETIIIPKLRDELDSNQWNFENIFLITDQRSLHDKNTYNSLKDSIKLSKITKSELDRYEKEYHELLQPSQELPDLFIDYSKYLVRLYSSMSTLSKLTNEPIYTWDMFIKIIDSVIAKIVRDITSNKKKKLDKDNDESEEQDDAKDAILAHTELDFVVDNEFFYNYVVPNVYAVICSGYKQENISLFNLIFALEIGKQRKTVTNDEFDFFFKNFLKFPNHKDWRKSNTNFIRFTDKMDKSQFIRLKRNQIKLYPKRRRLYEDFSDVSYTYREILDIINKYFEKESDELTLMETINLRFLAPDDEFRSKICQIVYEELLSIFDFNEESIKLHSFIKTASWSYPIAIRTHESINIVNTI